jgi:hypothetical protein
MLGFEQQRHVERKREIAYKVDFPPASTTRHERGGRRSRHKQGTHDQNSGSLTLTLSM